MNNKMISELRLYFKDIYSDPTQCEIAVREAINAYPIVAQDALFKMLYES